MPMIKVDGVEYDTDKMSDDAKKSLQALVFVEQGLQQLRNELAVCDTARLVYGVALKGELARGAGAKDGD